MSEPLPIRGTIDLADWAAGAVIREDKIQLQLLQNLQYLLESVEDIVQANFWALYAQQLQVGDVLGTPFA